MAGSFQLLYSLSFTLFIDLSEPQKICGFCMSDGSTLGHLVIIRKPCARCSKLFLTFQNSSVVTGCWSVPKMQLRRGHLEGTRRVCKVASAV